MTGKLSPAWRTWRNERRRAFVAAGMPIATAAELAARETRGRAEVTEAVGYQAAVSATLLVRREHGCLRTFLQGDWDDVPPEGRGTLEAMMESASAVIH